MAAKEGVTSQALCDKCPSGPLLSFRVGKLVLMLLFTLFLDHKLHAEAYEWFQIGFDHFGRTSTPLQTECVFPVKCGCCSFQLLIYHPRRIAQDIFLKLYNNGWFEEEEKEQLYCEKDQRFLADRFVEGTCPACQADVRRSSLLLQERT